MIAGSKDAEISANRISEVLSNIKYRRAEGNRPFAHEIVGWVESENRFAKIIIKYVPSSRSKSSKDELWVSTAYIVGEKQLRAGLRSRIFVEVGDMTQ